MKNKTIQRLIEARSYNEILDALNEAIDLKESYTQRDRINLHLIKSAHGLFLEKILKCRTELISEMKVKHGLVVVNSEEALAIIEKCFWDMIVEDRSNISWNEKININKLVEMMENSQHIAGLGEHNDEYQA